MVNQTVEDLADATSVHWSRFLSVMTAQADVQLNLIQCREREHCSFAFSSQSIATLQL
jgi:hypothetical protein